MCLELRRAIVCGTLNRTRAHPQFRRDKASLEARLQKMSEAAEKARFVLGGDRCIRRLDAFGMGSA